MLTKTGAKLLDFGLAKLRPVGTGSVAVSAAPTVTSPLTGAGSIVGTFQYMAPEQLEGQEADTRTDIFAFGAVVYEMVTGRRAFEGKSQASLIGAILRDTPQPMSARQAVSPRALDRLVITCLAKDPDDRWQTARDVTRQLKEVAEGTAADTAAVAGVAVVAGPKQRMSRAVFAAVLAGAAVGVFALWVMTPAPTPRAVQRVNVNAPPGARRVRISQDGTRLLYQVSVDLNGGGQLFLRYLDRLEAVPVAGAERAGAATFSPDGEWIAFQDMTDLALKKVQVSGGDVSTVSDVGIVMWSPTWMADGTIVFFLNAVTGLLQVRADGGRTEPLTSLRDGEERHAHASMLPNGDLLFTVWSSDRPNHLAVLSRDTRVITDLPLDATEAQYVPTGHLVYRTPDAALWAVVFDAEQSIVGDMPVRLADSVSTVGPEGDFDIALNGALVYVRGEGGTQRLEWVDRRGNGDPLGLPLGVYEAGVVLSPDGTRLAWGEGGDVFVSDVARPSPRRVVDGPGQGPLFVVWMPDGERLVYAASRNGVPGLYAVTVDAPDSEDTLLTLDSASALYPEGWSHDGTRLVMTYQDRESSDFNIGMLSIDDRKWEPYLRTTANEDSSSMHPSAGWIAFESDSAQPGVYGIYVARFPNLDNPRLVSITGRHPEWSVDGRELFYWTLDGTMMAVPVTGETRLTFGTPVSLFKSSVIGFFRMSPDDRFLLVREAHDDSAVQFPIVLVLNFFEELRQLVPTH